METEIETVQKEVLGANAPADTNKPEFKAAVGMSREWDARKAGREVAEDTLKKLNGKKPDFFLLFSTIHYEKYGGFQELLNGVWEVLPKGTPLIGGTVAGFMNNEGCYTRGVTAMAASYPNMDVAVGVGRNTRRRPDLAAKECSEDIKKKIRGSKYKNKFMFCIFPGGTIPQFPFIGRRKVMISGLLSKFSLDLLNLSIKLFQLGPGREEEVIESLSEYMPEWYILGGSSMDNLNQSRCFQFLGKEVFSKNLVSLALSTDLDKEILTEYGLIPTGRKLKITKKGLRDCAIRQIDGKPAVDEFLKQIGWPKDLLDERVYNRVFYYPLGYIYKGVLRPQIIGAFIGNDIACGYSIKSNEIEIMSASGKSIIESILKGVEEAKKRSPKMIIGVGCATQLETLGNHIYKIHESIKETAEETPFIIIYSAGEESYTPNSPPKQLYDSFNIGVIY